MDDQSVPLKWRLYGALNGFWINGKTVFATNEWFMQRLGCAERTLQDAMTELERIELLKRVSTSNGRVILPGGWGGAVPPHPKAQPHRTPSINALNIRNRFSKENHSIPSKKGIGTDVVCDINPDQIREILADPEGDAVLPRAPKAPKDPRNDNIRKHFRETCKKEIGEVPPDSIAAKTIVKRALARLTEKECIDKIDEWFGRSMPDQYLISITRCFSDNEVNGYKLGYAG